MRSSDGRARVAGPARVGVDVGGTFTDVVLVDEAGAIHTWKLPSTPDDFSRGVIDGVTSVLREHGVAPAAVRDAVHGSTVATNAILERRGARTGLLTTEGFRDVLELRRLRMPRLYDMAWQKPPPVVERRLRREVPERVGVDGGVVRPLDVDAARREAQLLVDEGVEAIAVSLLHAYANPEHERAVGELLEREFPGLWVSLSHRVLPIIREYERTSTTVLNAYVQPTVASYLGALRAQLDRAEVTGPLLIMQSNGGIMAASAAAARPAYIVESGPAAGVIAGAELARRLGIDAVITFDMGGTTAKASLVEGGRPHFTAEFEVAAGISASSRLSSGGGYALSVPFIDLAEVGAGGGSLVWLDPAGAPKVGPRSAGADPGPVCYGRGGDQPTVTDANLLLGYLNPTGLLDGAMPLDVERAREVFRRDVAGPLGLGVEAAAHGAHELANASMIRAIKAVSVQRGRDPRDFTLVAFGGSGPIHAASLARELGIRRVLVPPRPGVFSAVGLLQARLEFHAKKTYLRRLRDLSLGELRAEIAGLEAEARAGLGPDALRAGAFEFERFVEMRYVGQGFELPVLLPSLESDGTGALDGLAAAFDAEHERTYGHRTGNEAEVVHLRVVLREADPPPFPDAPAAATSGRPAGSRGAYFGNAFGALETRVLRRGDVGPEAAVGPFVVEDYDATTVVPPDFRLRRDAADNLLIEAMG
jgi:N-methylhydantoinase A